MAKRLSRKRAFVKICTSLVTAYVVLKRREARIAAAELLEHGTNVTNATPESNGGVTLVKVEKASDIKEQEEETCSSGEEGCADALGEEAPSSAARNDRLAYISDRLASLGTKFLLALFTMAAFFLWGDG
jgi:hypothetical protein